MCRTAPSQPANPDAAPSFEATVLRRSKHHFGHDNADTFRNVLHSDLRAA